MVSSDDGHVSRFGLEGLRTRGPCAKCRNLREVRQPAWPTPGAPETLRVADPKQVGNWGLNLHWNDGHTTGIYRHALDVSGCIGHGLKLRRVIDPQPGVGTQETTWGVAA